MKTFYHFFRLLRPLNLAVIALTMGVFQVFVSRNESQEWLQIDFLFLVLSTLFIAAAGNIINDYFDVKADRVNKPEALIIDKHIKRRWAIVFNWIFNSVGLLFALYLGWKYQSWMLAIVPFFSINLLWFYSMYFKRTLILGNVIVAFLTALVPLYVLLLNDQVDMLDKAGNLVLLFSGYAFWLNLTREIIKDIADVKGDLLLNSKTLPIVLGIGKTKGVVLVLQVFALIPLFLLIYWMISINGRFSTPFILALLVCVTIISSMITLILKHQRKNYLFSSNLLKLAMFFGLLIPLFL